MKIVSHFKTVQDVKKYLQAVEEYTDWTWENGLKPTYWGLWKPELDDFYITFENRFFRGHQEIEGDEIIHFEDAILELKKRAMEMKEGDLVYVSNVSEKDALEAKEKRTLLRKCSDGVVCIGVGNEGDYKEGKKFVTQAWSYAVPAPKEQPKKKVTLELTDEELEKIKELIN